MPDIILPEEIQQIIWKKVYSDNVVSSILNQAKLINKNNNFQIYNIPIEFWFKRNSALALPIVALPFNNLDIYLEYKN